MNKYLLVLVALCCLNAQPAAAQQLEGDQLYRVTTVRAATGSFAELLAWAVPKNETDFFVMRHSQGDHWDLMFVTPLATLAVDPLFDDVDELIAFREDTFARGPSAAAFASAYADNAFYHIEMFEAAPGKTQELLRQRRMENDYLAATGQVANMIFHSVAGTDVDVFTIGFHEDLEAFAAPAPATDEEKEAAAKAAGFSDRADISFYLRALISGHHDTLAVKAQ
ncbi:MAG: hypothetical protein R3358_05930 [Woeseiaceae bacterium]|nr:hypothetical protein [Woeseiaceae bacterium]